MNPSQREFCAKIPTQPGWEWLPGMLVWVEDVPYRLIRRDGAQWLVSDGTILVPIDLTLAVPDTEDRATAGCVMDLAIRTLAYYNRQDRREIAKTLVQNFIKLVAAEVDAADMKAG